MLDNAKLIEQSLIGTFQYFGLQEKQIDETKYYLIHTGCNHPLWNMIVLPDIVIADQMNKMEEIFKKQKLPFAWWVDEKIYLLKCLSILKMAIILVLVMYQGWFLSLQIIMIS